MPRNILVSLGGESNRTPSGQLNTTLITEDAEVRGGMPQRPDNKAPLVESIGKGCSFTRANKGPILRTVMDVARRS